MLSAVLISVAILDTAYVGYLFNQGRVDTIWPVKLLRCEGASSLSSAFASGMRLPAKPLATCLNLYSRRVRSSCTFLSVSR